MFREVVLAFLGGDGSDKGTPKKLTKEEQYCRLCKASKKNTDCDKCSMAHGA